MSIDLSANYGGLFLHSPIVVGACPLTLDDHTRLSLEKAGAGAIVMPSLFEEQIIRWAKEAGQSLDPREQSLLSRSERYRVDAACPNAESYLALVERASSHLNIPVIASLNGFTASQWLSFAGDLQAAGAAAIELNVHHAPIHNYSGSHEIEDAIADAISVIRQAITVPLFVKLERGHVSIPHLARRVCSGASGFVLYGRQPDVNICLDSRKLNATWNLTSPRSAIELIGPIMQTHGYCPSMSIAASGGISTCEDVIKVLLAGADVAMVTSAIYRRGPDLIRMLIDGLVVYLERHRFKSLLDLQMQRPIEFADNEERAAYVAALSARLDRRHTQTADQPARGDRWGHLQVAETRTSND